MEARLKELRHKWREELKANRAFDRNQMQLVFARQIWQDFVEDNRREVKRKSEQLRLVAELSAVTCGFALMGFYQLTWFDTDLGPTNPVTLSTFFAISGVACVGFLMAATTLTLTALTRLVSLGNEATNVEMELKFFDECWKWSKPGGGRDKGKAAPLQMLGNSFQTTWSKLEPFWRVAFCMFIFGINIFLVNLILAIWLRWNMTGWTYRLNEPASAAGATAALGAGGAMALVGPSPAPSSAISAFRAAAAAISDAATAPAAAIAPDGFGASPPPPPPAPRAPWDGYPGDPTAWAGTGVLLFFLFVCMAIQMHFATELLGGERDADEWDDGEGAPQRKPSGRTEATRSGRTEVHRASGRAEGQGGEAFKSMGIWEWYRAEEIPDEPDEYGEGSDERRPGPAGAGAAGNGEGRNEGDGEIVAAGSRWGMGQDGIMDSVASGANWGVGDDGTDAWGDSVAAGSKWSMGEDDNGGLEQHRDEEDEHGGSSEEDPGF